MKKNNNSLNAPLFESPEEKRKDRKLMIFIGIMFVLLVASGVLVMNIIESANHRDPGYHTLTAERAEDVPLYASGISFVHYFGGESNEIRAAIDQLNRTYSAHLKRLYKLTDPTTMYGDMKNIAYINAHLGEEIVLDKELFDILVSAFENTESGRFNLFAGALNSEWQAILSLNEPAEFDPLINDSERERIAKLAEDASELSNFTFEVLDEESCTVRISVSARYLASVRVLERSESIVDLGQLREAYMLDQLRSALESDGYRDGYIAATNGVTVAFSEMQNIGSMYSGFGVKDGEPQSAFAVSMQPSSSGCLFRSVGFEGELGYYAVESGGRSILRHPHYSIASGEQSDALLSALVVVDSERFGAVEAYLKASELYAQTSVESALEKVGTSSSGELIAVIANDGTNTIRVAAEHRDRLSVIDDGFTVLTLPR